MTKPTKNKKASQTQCLQGFKSGADPPSLEKQLRWTGPPSFHKTEFRRAGGTKSHNH